MLRFHRPLLAAGLATSLLASAALIIPAGAQSAPPMRLAQAPAPADRGAVGVDTFYDRLSGHGSWVQHPDYRYVFVPSGTGPGWRPYQEGRWVWTDQYGWYWDSYEPFGWATYHYGRWGYEPAYGWFWVPGDTWAPAWVTWRRGGGRTGWAPVAPDREGFAVGRANYYDPPVAESWVFVEDRYMGEEDIALYAAPIPQIGIYLAAAPDYYEPAWDGGYYVNRGFGVDVYDAPIRDRVVVRDVVYVDRSDDLFFGGGSLGIFAPRFAFGDRYGAPRRYERELDPGRRTVLRQYVEDDRPVYAAPSAALLAAIDPDRRRELRERRFSDRDRYQQELRALERERADRVNELRREAATRRDTLERERRQEFERRRQEAERVRQERQSRAGQIGNRPDAPRPDGPRPGNQRPDDQRPGTRPDGQPGSRPDARPGVPAPPGANASPQERQRIEAERRRAQEQERRAAEQDRRRQEAEQRRNAQEEQRARAQQERDRQRQQTQERNQQRQNAEQQQRRQEQDASRREAEQRRDAQRRSEQEQRRQQQERQQQQRQQQQERQQIQRQQAPRPDAEPRRAPQPGQGSRPPQPSREQAAPQGERRGPAPEQRRPPQQGWDAPRPRGGDAPPAGGPGGQRPPFPPQ